MSADDLESLEETLRVLSTPSAREELAAYQPGDSWTAPIFHRRYGLASR